MCGWGGEGACMAEERVCLTGRACVWLEVHAWLGVCMSGGWGMHSWEVCAAGGAWLEGRGMHGWGAYMCGWGRIYMACGRRGVCVTGHTLPCMVDKQVVHILLECLLV